MRVLNVGDKIWWARCGVELVQEKCTVCYGNREVTLILGNGERVTLPCEYCACGYEAPKGYTTRYKYIAEPQYVAITGVRVNQTCKGDEREYTVGHYNLSEDVMFDTQKEATEKCAEIAVAHDKEEQRRAGCTKANKTKHFSWSAGYHRKNIKDLQRQIQYHEANARLCENKPTSSTSGGSV